MAEQAAQTEKAPLWGGMKIPIIVLSGEVNSGKSIFPLLIDPVCRLPKEQTEPTTIVFDQEGSCETYEGSLNFKWLDTRAAVFNGVHRQIVASSKDDPKWLTMLKTTADVNDSPAASMFRAAYLSMLAIEPGKYRVMAYDTFTPIQDGMVDWLRKHPAAFGRTTNQYEKASSMFLWPDVKAMLGHILAVDCRLRFETVVLTVHMKAKWEGDRKTKERIAEGLDVLDKLATLHIRLERKPDGSGNVSKEPVGLLVKERLLRFGATPADDSPILPPRIEKCTPDTIREYIAAPANYTKLRKSQKVVIAEPTEIEMQAMKLATAEAEAEAATAQTNLVDRQKELLAIRQAAKTPEGQAAEATKARKEDAALATKMAEQQKEGERLNAAAPPDNLAAHRQPQPQPQPPDNRVERFKVLSLASGVDPGKLKAAIVEHGVSRFTELSEQHQDALLSVLQKAADAKQVKREKAPGDNIPF